MTNEQNDFIYINISSETKYASSLFNYCARMNNNSINCQSIKHCRNSNRLIKCKSRLTCNIDGKITITKHSKNCINQLKREYKAIKDNDFSRKRQCPFGKIIKII